MAYVRCNSLCHCQRTVARQVAAVLVTQHLGRKTVQRCAKRWKDMHRIAHTQFRLKVAAHAAAPRTAVMGMRRG